MDSLSCVRFPTRQRDLANLRERRRMMLINKGFEQLRNRLPLDKLIVFENSRNIQQKIKRRTARLTKVDILKLTILYINQLRALLSGNEMPPLTPNSSHLLDHPERATEIKKRGTCKPWHKKSSSDTRRGHQKGKSGNYSHDGDYRDDMQAECDLLVKCETKFRVRSDLVERIEPSMASPAWDQTQRVKVHIKCSGGEFYSLSWSKNSDIDTFHSKDEFHFELKRRELRKVLKNTKLWNPEAGLKS